MSLPLNDECYVCHLRRNVETARAAAGEKAATQVAKGLLALYLSAPEDASSPMLGPETSALLQQYCGIAEDRFREEKQLSNAFVLARMDQIRSRVQTAADPVYAGLQGAILGNYIDFSALQGEVSFEKLEQMLTQADDIHVDPQTYQALRADLAQAKTLLYLTDNAGEIGFDRVFAEAIAQAYPQLQITFCVRGGNAANDATRADAEQIGIPFPVIDNGTCIAGTVPRMLGAEAAQALETADVILSKGQANVETLYGCGKNIYYAFLVKCVRFMTLFQKPKLTPMLVNERTLHTKC